MPAAPNGAEESSGGEGSPAAGLLIRTGGDEARARAMGNAPQQGQSTQPHDASLRVNLDSVKPGCALGLFANEDAHAAAAGYWSGSDPALVSCADATHAQHQGQSALPEEPEGSCARSICRKEKRHRQKQNVNTLDALLPEAFRRNPVKNCAGRRSMGTEGRSLHDVLVDTIQCLKSMKSHHESVHANCCGPTIANEHTHAQTEASSREVSPETMRDGIMSSRSLAVMELEMPSWTVISLNPAAKDLFGDTPWGSCEGQCLANSIVPFEDMPILENMWLEAQSASTTYAQAIMTAAEPMQSPPRKPAPYAPPSEKRTIRFSRYFLHDPIQEKDGGELSSGAYVPLERAVSIDRAAIVEGAASGDGFPHAFAPDQLFEGASATGEFDESGCGRASGERGRGEDGAPDVAWNKTKKSGRKFISCHLVASHVQLLSIAPKRRSRLAELWQRWGGKSSNPQDVCVQGSVKPGEDATSVEVEADGMGSQWAQTGAHNYTGKQLQTMKPCSRCKANHKSVTYCIQRGHVPVSVSSHSIGKQPAGMRSLLLISKCKDTEVGRPTFEEGLIRLSRMSLHPFRGIFRLDPSCLAGGNNLTVGQCRAFFGYNSLFPTEHTSVIQTMWQKTAGWCSCFFDDFKMRFVQIHLILDKDNDGIPFSLVHTRLSFGMFQTRWQLTACASLDGKPGLNHNQSRQRLNVYSSMSLVVAERGALGVQELQLGDRAWPKFPNRTSGMCGGTEGGPHVVKGSEQEQGMNAPAERLFPLRAVRWHFSENEMIQTGECQGLGTYKFRWVRVGPLDRSCYIDDDLHLAPKFAYY